MRFHHLGVPTTEPRPGEEHVPHLGVHVVPYTSNPFGIEWMRFDAGCDVPELVKTVPHLAFVVPSLEAALAGREVLIAPNSPTAGVRVAFVVCHGAPVELMEIEASVAHLYPCP